MNNSDFQRLLTTNDRELVNELTKRKPANKKKTDEERKKRFKGAGKGGEDGKGRKGSGKGKGEPKKGERPTGGQPAGNANEYRDRAKERREQKGEYETIANEWEGHAEINVEQSKYLGGDLEHTHLVKGLDFALLKKVRGELDKKQKTEEAQQQRVERKQQKHQKRSFETVVAKRIWNTVVETLHPHHSTFKERIGRMGKAISMGQRIRGAPGTFLPGRMNYEFDTDANQGSTDIPRIVFLSKEDAPKVDFSKKCASVLPGTVTRMRDALQRAIDRKKQAKKEKTAGAVASFTVTQKVAPRYKAKDLKDKDDIFQGAGGFDTTLVGKAEKPESSAKAEKKPSYFDDAGHDKFLEAPEGQIDLEDVEVDEKDDEGAGSAPSKPKELAFEPSESFKGARPGWVFKLGEKGLGYYCEDAKAASAKPAPRDTRRQPPKASKKSGHKSAAVPDEDDAYGECFPSAMLGHARVATGEQGDSDAEEEEDTTKKKIEKMKKLAQGGKKGSAEGDSLAANQKAEAKKRKMSEQQEWQKIDKMIKKGNFKSMEELEASTTRQRRSGAPVPREIMATPAFF